MFIFRSINSDCNLIFIIKWFLNHKFCITILYRTLNKHIKLTNLLRDAENNINFIYFIQNFKQT